METKSTPQFEIREPRFFRTFAILWIYMYGLLIGAPVLLAVAWVSFQPLSAKTYLIPMAALALATLCLPIGFGNSFVRKLARKIPGANNPPPALVVQLTANPRLRTGLRATLEDADDIGWLTITDTHLVYQGDSISFKLPFENLEAPARRNIGFRGMFVYVGRLTLKLRGVEGVREIAFADRQSLFLPQSQRRIRELHERLKSCLTPQ